MPKKQGIVLVPIQARQDRTLLLNAFRKMTPTKPAPITAGIREYCSITAPVSTKSPRKIERRIPGL